VSLLLTNTVYQDEDFIISLLLLARHHNNIYIFGQHTLLNLQVKQFSLEMHVNVNLNRAVVALYQKQDETLVLRVLDNLENIPFNLYLFNRFLVPIC